jgi:hypothetical protein
MLKNPFTRIAVATALSTLITPRLINAVMTPEINPGDGVRNELMVAGVSGAAAAFVYVLLSMAAGPAAAAGSA